MRHICGRNFFLLLHFSQSLFLIIVTTKGSILLMVNVVRAVLLDIDSVCIYQAIDTKHFRQHMNENTR